MKVDLDLGLLRRHRIRLIRQTEVTECGLAALAMVAQYHGLRIDLGTLRQRFQVSLRGATLKSLIVTADAMGLAPRALKLNLSQLDSLVVPAVLHWDMKHFVVVEKVSRGRALIHDPAGHSRWLPFDEISRHFTGVSLELVPSDDFEPSDQTARLRLRQLWHRITGLKRALLQTLVLSLVMQVFVLASPYYMQVAVDQALPALDRDLIAVLALGFGIFTLINAGAFLLRSFVIMSAGASLGFGISVNVGRRLLRLPIAWFERRHVGDVLSRFQSINPIRQFMTEGAIGSVLDGTLALATLAVMLFYSVELTFVALVAFALYGLVRLASFSAQRSAQEEAIAATGQEQSVMIETLRGIVTLRLYNKEAARSAFWQSRLTEALNANVGLARITAWQGAGNVLIMGVETILSTWLAVRLVIDGGFSVGMVFAFLAYKTQFLQKAASLTDQLIGFRMLGLHLERLSDIALAPPDPSFTEQALVRRELKGRLELRGIRFRYSPSDAWTLDGVNLLVEPGENIVISGPSGGGKSTLLKIILGLIEPDEGELLIDGIPLVRFGHKHFHDQVGAVLQDDSLFAGSLMNNIALFDDEPDQMRAYEVARMASVHDDIAAMPMRYETLVGDMGSTLSGGQRQRLLLARALYRGPRMLVIDEGTSHLDPAREQSVNSAIGSLGITRISVAHRLETVLSGDRQYSLRDGTLVEITGQMHALTHDY